MNAVVLCAAVSGCYQSGAYRIDEALLRHAHSLEPAAWDRTAIAAVRDLDGQKTCVKRAALEPPGRSISRDQRLVRARHRNDTYTEALALAAVGTLAFAVGVPLFAYSVPFAPPRIAAGVALTVGGGALLGTAGILGLVGASRPPAQELDPERDVDWRCLDVRPTMAVAAPGGE